ncbi:MAG: LON peptidase substrate-binding domain-containing protein [Hyphomicrobiaceae bacterium]
MFPPPRYNHTSDLPSSIPLFPLTGAILLPRATMPLNVFEPRYLAMIDNAIAGARIIGIVQPLKPDPDQESPQEPSAPLKNVGCAGRITAFQELDDGRILISLTGVARFKVVEEAATDEPYRVCRIDHSAYENDLIIGYGEEDVDRAALLDGLRSYLELNNLDADWDAIAKAPTELLVNSLSVISPFGYEEKQALLEAPDLKARAETLATLAKMELASTDAAGGGQLQ